MTNGPGQSDDGPKMTPSRTCCVCGAHLGYERTHRHEVSGWKPDYDDFEGALQGYETVSVGEA